MCRHAIARGRRAPRSTPPTSRQGPSRVTSPRRRGLRAPGAPPAEVLAHARAGGLLGVISARRGWSAPRRPGAHPRCRKGQYIVPLGPCAAGWGWGARHHQTARLCIDTCDYFARAWCGQCRAAEPPAQALAHRQACRRQALQVGRGVQGPPGRARPVPRSPWRPSQVGSAICCAMGTAGPLGPRARSVATVGPPRPKVSPPAPLEASIFI